MASKNDEYGALREEIASGNIGVCYILYGEERYLLEHIVSELRKKLVPEGGGFNHHRYGASVDIATLREAVSTFPFFAERTLVEISDFDFSSGLSELLPVLRDLPEYACVLFVCGAELKLDNRTSAAKELRKLARVAEFKVQDSMKLVPWITRHFKSLGCTVSQPDAEYLAFITGGLMSSLRLEIEKLAAHHEQKNAPVTRDEIDELVAPVPDAVSYKFTDAVAEGSFRAAARILDELIAMREAPHRLLYALTSKMRSLLLAKYYSESGRSVRELMNATGTRYEFQAKNLMSAAKRTTVQRCSLSLRLCWETAFRLNDGGGMESVTELLARLALAAS